MVNGDVSDGTGLSAAPIAYRFLGLTLDLRTLEVLRGSERVLLSPQSFALLRLLVRERSRTLGRDELAAEVWPGIRVGEGSLRQAVSELRQALRRSGTGEEGIDNVRGRGYRFVAPVEELREDAPTARPERRQRTSSAVHARAVVRQAPLRKVVPRAELFGRDAELRTLTTTLAPALEQRGTTCLVLGQAGMGKTRLVQAFAEQARSEGHVVCSARAERDAGAPPLWPWLELLERRLHEASPGLRAEVEKSAPELAAVLAHGELHDSGAPGMRRFRVFEQLSRALCTLSRAEPFVFVLEDLHWADETTLAFLAHAARNLHAARILLVLSARPLPPRVPRELRVLSHTLRALAEDPQHLVVNLAPLRRDAVESLLGGVLGAPAAPTLAADVFALSGGNPLFVQELGRVCRANPERALAATIASEPLALAKLIEMRLQEGDEGERAVLGAAAVLGGDFTLLELAPLLEEEPAHSLPRLEACLAAGLLVEQEGGTFAFAHPLLAEICYAGLTLEQRASLHLRAASWLERRSDAGSARYASALAHHYREARLLAPARALDAFVYAAEQAFASTAFDAAAAHYTDALRAADGLTGMSAERRLELELSRAEALHAAGNQDFERLYVPLAERAEALSAPDLFARAALGAVGHHTTRFVPGQVLGDRDVRTLQLLERALVALGETPSRLRVTLLCALAYAHASDIDRSVCRDLLARARADADTLGEPHVTCAALGYSLHLATGPDDLALRLAWADRMVEVALEHGLPELELEARVSRVIVRYCAGTRVGVAHDVQRGCEIAGRIGTPYAQARALVPELLDAFANARFDDVSSLLSRTRAIGDYDANQRELYGARLAALSLLRDGETGPIIPICEGMLARFPALTSAQATLASAYAREGRSDAARALFDAAAAQDFRAIPRDVQWLPTMSFFADTAVSLRDEQRAARVYRALEPYAGQFFCFGIEAMPGGCTALWLADLANVMGELDAARRWLAEARAVHEALSFSLLNQLANLVEGRIARVDGGEIARARGTRALTEARAFAEQHGVGWLRVMCDAAARDLVP